MSDPVYLGNVAAGLGGFVVLGRDAEDALGLAVSAVGDLNGDGFDDIVIGTSRANGADSSLPNAGESYVVFGRASGFDARLEGAELAAGNGGFVIYGRDAGDFSAGSVAAAGDVNGDGFADLIIGAIGGAGPGNAVPGAGESYVVFGKASGFGSSIYLEDVAAGNGGFVIYGRGMDSSGQAVAGVGDFNGDGFDDLIIGAVNADTESAGSVANGAGASFVVFGRASGFESGIDLADVAAGSGGILINGRDTYDLSGWSVGSAGDFNGDGFVDLLVGAPYGDGADNTVRDAGETYIVFGRAGGSATPIALEDVAAGIGGVVIYGRDSYDGSGRPATSAGDINGDGFDDILIGARYADGGDNLSWNTGEVYVVFGRAEGSGPGISLEDVASGTGGFVIYGRDAFDNLGSSVAAAGDIDGDGFDDLVIGATGADGIDNGTPDSGESYVVFGSAEGFAAGIDLEEVAAGIGGFVIYGQDPVDTAGYVAAAGDMNGDGFDDLLIGAANADGSGNALERAGESYVVFGSAALRGGPVPCTADRVDLTGAGGGTISARCGNDSYLVDDPLDRPVEARGEGYDTVHASISWVLAPHFEALVLGGTDTAHRLQGIGNGMPNHLRGSTAGDRLRGLENNDTLLGAGGDDVLDGDLGNDLLVGGAGNDTLGGGAGSDAFRFDAPLSAANNRDRIIDFEPGRDSLRLDDDVFRAFSVSESRNLAPGQFHAAPGVRAAHDADDRIVYDTSSGALYYDADGTGDAVAIKFAVLTAHPAITAADFVIVA